MPQISAAQLGIAPPRGGHGQPRHASAQTAGNPCVYDQGVYDTDTYADGVAAYDVTCYDCGRYGPLPTRDRRARYGAANYDRGDRYN